MIVSVDNILNVFEKDLYKGCSNKRKLYSFERFKMSNINYIYSVLESGNYNMGKYNIFMIKYPKYRVIMSLNMADKVINHYIAKYCLLPKLSKYLDNRNIATRKDMGSSYGVKLIKKYIELNKKYDRFYVLKLDISKYFYSIDHDVLKSMLINDLDSIEYKLMCTIIDSTNEEYINNSINKLVDNELLFNSKFKSSDIARYKYKKGLPIGNMTSQFLGIYYLNRIDHFIVHNLGIKYMIRYMDDYVLVHNDKTYLVKCMNIIKDKLYNEYKLCLNLNKCKIYNIKNGFDFLGYNFKVINNKTIVRISYKTINNISNKIKYNLKCFNNDCYKYFYSSINNYYNCFKYGNSLVVKRFINRKL